MKSFVCAVLLVAVVSAEPPSYRQVKFGTATTESSHDKKSDAESTSYPAAGFKPTKQFNLPVHQQLSPPAASYGTPEDSYTAPFNTFLAPQVEYGPPNAKISERRKDVKKETHSFEIPSSSESSESASKESKSSEKKGSAEKKDKSQKIEKKVKSLSFSKPQTEKSEKTEKNEKKQKGNLEDASKSDEIISTQGAYFVLLPSSQLQRVQYKTQNDLTKMAYTASLQYMNDKTPVFIYTPTAQYQEIAQPVVSAYSYTW